MPKIGYGLLGIGVLGARSRNSFERSRSVLVRLLNLWKWKDDGFAMHGIGIEIEIGCGVDSVIAES